VKATDGRTNQRVGLAQRREGEGGRGGPEDFYKDVGILHFPNHEARAGRQEEEEERASAFIV